MQLKGKWCALPYIKRVAKKSEENATNEPLLGRDNIKNFVQLAFCAADQQFVQSTL